MATKKALSLRIGDTFKTTVRWETDPVIYVPITGITRAGPAVVTVPNHPIPDGWRGYVQSVKGMVEINNVNIPPKKDSEWRRVTVVDNNTIKLNQVDSSLFTAYTSGGYLVINTPHPLTDYKARLTIRDKAGGTQLMQLTTENGMIVIDEANFKILIEIPAAETAVVMWKKGVYDLELILPGNTPDEDEITTVAYGPVTAVVD